MQVVNGGPQVSQPWNQVLFPGLGEGAPRGMNARIARAIPAVSRACNLLGGMASQMPIERVAGEQVLPPVPLLRRPDPTKSRSWFVAQHWWDYLLHGNAVHYVTARNEWGEPAAAMWLPAEQITISWDVDDPTEVGYWMGGAELDRRNIVHVQRGADPWCPGRGVGAVEQHLRALETVDKQEGYQHQVLDGSAIPSVAITTPNPNLSQEEADEAQTTWIEKYGGSGRVPGVFPSGTVVTPLSWSPDDSQMVEARQASLTDVANMFNIDGYWLGAPSSSHTYRSPGPMYLNLLRQSVNPILEQFEDVWGWWWLNGRSDLKFQRRAVLADDFASSVRTGQIAVREGLMSKGEVRSQLLGLPAQLPEGEDEQGVDARGIAETIQKVYLGVGKVIDADEAREIVRLAGAPLKDETPPEVADWRPPGQTESTPDSADIDPEEQTA